MKLSCVSPRVSNRRPQSFIKALIWASRETKQSPRLIKTSGGAYYNKNYPIINFFKGIGEAFKSK